MKTIRFFLTIPLLAGLASAYAQERVQEPPIILESLLMEYEPLKAEPVRHGCPQSKIIERDAVSAFLRLPRRDISILLSGGGIETPEGNYSLRGSRNAPLMFVDGVKMRGNAYVPFAALNEVTITWGALPADIGDTDGGAVFFRTRSTIHP